uniref:Uncharacterized protein n=1 Tax=Arundo donax TaxID=35708 RepID=A0A0A9GIN6_ARUDO
MLRTRKKRARTDKTSKFNVTLFIIFELLSNQMCL